MKARRVLHVLPDLQRGGGQTLVLELVRHGDRRRYDAYVARLGAPDALADAFGAAGRAPILLLHGGDGALAAALEVARHVRRLGIDIIHVHSDRDRKVGQLAALVTGTPVVGHLHSPWAHLEPMHGPDAGPARRRWSRTKAAGRGALERRVVRHYVAASGDVAAFHAGRVHAPITVVPNGIDTARVRPPTEFERRRLRQVIDVDGHDAVLVCVGRLTAGKGHEDVLDALAAVPRAALLVAGDGELRDSLADRAESLGVTARVRFLGDLVDVRPALGAADLFVFGSRTEGMPLAVLEAMAAGLPVVGYDIPGLRAVVSPGVDGALVPLGDTAALGAAIVELLDDYRRREAMAAAARRAVEARFDARKMAIAAERVYDDVLATADDRGRVRNGDQLAAS